jgi:hypothetical protein
MMTVGETASRLHRPQGERLVTAVMRALDGTNTNAQNMMWARLDASLDSGNNRLVQNVP